MDGQVEWNAVYLKLAMPELSFNEPPFSGKWVLHELISLLYLEFMNTHSYPSESPVVNEQIGAIQGRI